MSQFALVSADDVSDEPRILSFLEFAGHRSRSSTSSVAIDDRARIQLSNRSCPICNRITVESIELNNGIWSRNGRMVPGTGTLVGFSCNACGHEWPA